MVAMTLMARGGENRLHVFQEIDLPRGGRRELDPSAIRDRGVADPRDAHNHQSRGQAGTHFTP